MCISDEKSNSWSSSGSFISVRSRGKRWIIIESSGCDSSGRRDSMSSSRSIGVSVSSSVKSNHGSGWWL